MTYNIKFNNTVSAEKTLILNSISECLHNIILQLFSNLETRKELFIVNIEPLKIVINYFHT